jgi:hypothetical protein
VCGVRCARCSLRHFNLCNVQQCGSVRHCAAVRAAVCGSACSSVLLSGSAHGSVRQCAAIQQFAAVWQCGSAPQCGSVQYSQINSKCIRLDLYKVVMN